MSSVLVMPGAQLPATSLPPSRQNPHSISELLQSSEMYLERRSLPSLRLAATQSSKPKSPRIDTPLTERPCSSSSSTSSFRRSVSGMKQLLPFQLQPTPPLPKVDLAAWLNGAVHSGPSRDLHDANPLEYEPIRASPHSQRFAWMPPSQDVRYSDKLQPSRYRETPVYSEPRSPQLGLAYFRDVDSCSRCSPPGFFCDELCIVNDYSDSESVEVNSEASFVNHNEASASMSTGLELAGTSPTSFRSSRSSALSIACQGEHIGPNATRWTTGCPSRCDEENVLVIADTNDVLSPIMQHGRMDAIMRSDISRCSSHSDNDEIYNALTAQVANAKAHVVEISRKVLLSSSSPRSTSPCQSHPVTSQEPRRKIAMGGYQVLCKTDMGNAEGQLSQQQNWQMRLSSPLPRLPYDSLHPKHPQGEKLEERDLEAMDFRGENSENNCSIIELIQSVVESFPKNMLTLDTSCVVDIRRSSRLYTPPPAANRISAASMCSLDYLATPRKSWRFSLRRSGNRASYFSSKQAKVVEPEPSGRQFMSSKSRDRLGSKEFTAANMSLPSPPAPDLSPFRKIFPMTSDWWRGFLYAHMVAYNYICEARAICQFSPFNASGKALETLGLSKSPSSPMGPPSATSRMSLDILRINLLSCIDQLTSFMLEKSNTFVSTEAARQELKGDEAFVQALAEIVKLSENSGAVDVRLSAYC